MSKLVIIEDSVVTALLSNPKLLADVPALKAAADAKGGTPGCKPCQRKALSKSFNYSKVKRVIGNLRGADLQRIKQELNTEKIRVLYASDGGRLVQVTL